MKQIDKLKEDLERNLDALQREGLFVDHIYVRSEDDDAPWDKRVYRREIDISLTTGAPDYAKPQRRNR